MAYVGNTPFTAAFLTDTFSGNGSTVAFTMSVAPASTSSVIVAVTGVLQDPSTYSVSGTTLTFSAAPPTGTSNISVRYLGIPASGVTTTAYRTVTDTTATAGQTTFNIPSYTVGYINVFRNGALLAGSDYTATSGTTVVLNNAASAGDTITTESFYVSSVLNALANTGGTLSGQLTINSATGQKPLIAQVNGTEVFEVDSAGNVGIGTSSPAYKLDVSQTSGDVAARVFANATTTSSRLEITNGDGTTAINYSYIRFINNKTSSQDWRFGTYGNNNLSFVNVTAGTTPMTLDSSGNLLVGTTSVAASCKTTIATSSNNQLAIDCTTGTGTVYSTIVFSQSQTTKTQLYQDHGATRFYIVNNTNGLYLAANATAWTAVSDERAKENLVPITNAASKVSSLRAVTGNYISDESKKSRAFLIAQDVQSVLPEAVDSSDSENLGVQYTDVIPLLVAAIKEQQALIQQLQADVAALKGNS